MLVWNRIKKFLIFSIIIIVIVASAFLYLHYNIKSVKTNDENNLSLDTGNPDGNNTIGEDINFPNTILLTGPTNVINYNNVTFTWAGTDDITSTDDLLYSYLLKGNIDEWSPWTKNTSATYTNLPNGEYTFFVKAKDRAGNIDPIPVEELFIVDVVEEPKTRIYYVYWPLVKENLQLDYTLFANKNNPFIETIKIPQENLKNISFNLAWKDDITSPLLHFGKDTLTFSIKAPNATEIYRKESIGEGALGFIKSDINTKPSISSLDAENLSTARTMLKSYYSNNWNNESIQIEVHIKIGELRLLRRLRDKGNDFNLKISYEYYEPHVSDVKDNSPDTNIKSAPSGTVNKQTVYFSWEGNDDITPLEQLRYSYKLEQYDAKWSSWTTETSKTYAGLTEGEYTFFVKTKDHRGNIDPTPAEQSFTIDLKNKDTIPPNTSILTGPTGIINYSTITFTWTGTDDTTSTTELKYRYILEGKDTTWSTWTTTITKTYSDLPNADYIFKIKAKDKAGNIDPTPAQQSFTVDVEGGEPNRFATEVIEFNPGTGASSNTERILGGPKGKGGYEQSLDVLTLGEDGSITLGFDATIINGPGRDFIVFENPFYINDAGGTVFGELAYIEVSTDGQHFARFPSVSSTAGPISPGGGFHPMNVTNLAGAWPVYANVDENNIDPFDPEEAGGDAFDLEELVNDPLVQSGDVDLQHINYIKIIDIIGDGSRLDSQGKPIYDPTEGTNGTDIDSVAIINYAEK